MNCCHNPDVVWIHHCKDVDMGDFILENENHQDCHRKCSNCDSGICEEC